MKLQTVIKLLILPVVGIIIMMMPFVRFVRDVKVPDIVKVTAPGSAKFVIQEDTTVVVWREVVGISSHDEFRVMEEKLPPGLRISIKDADSGTKVGLKESMGSSFSSGNNQTKVSLVKADLSPGSYEIVADLAGDTMDLTLAPERVTLGSILSIIAFAVLGGLIFLAGIIYALVVVIKHLARPTPPAQV